VSPVGLVPKECESISVVFPSDTSANAAFVPNGVRVFWTSQCSPRSAMIDVGMAVNSNVKPRYIVLFAPPRLRIAAGLMLLRRALSHHPTQSIVVERNAGRPDAIWHPYTFVGTYAVPSATRT